MTLFWFRRDLRLQDNKGLVEALKQSESVQPIFIFDTDIINELPKDDARLNFIYDQLEDLHNLLNNYDSGIKIYFGKPIEVWKEIVQNENIEKVFFNRDYEPYAIQRDKEITELLREQDVSVYSFKDQVIFEPDEVLKDDGTPYTIYTPYSKKWKQALKDTTLKIEKPNYQNFIKKNQQFPKKKELGIVSSSVFVLPYNLDKLDTYDQYRNYPTSSTTNIGPHLRFGTVSIREIVNHAIQHNETYLNELIWREFFMQILYHFPKSIASNFKSKYDSIDWRNDLRDFEKWKYGNTGYPIVDAGMRQLNTEGYMHNRVRMIVASFLCKHLLIHWSWGEAYFAEKLLDYELASNVGNWQWAAGTGCDAAPYFRVFNPYEQQKKFDPEFIYTRKWVPEFETTNYAEPMVEHKFARERALKMYKRGLEVNF